jgi:hypothetical protein
MVAGSVGIPGIAVNSPSLIRCAIWSSALAIACAAFGFTSFARVRLASQSVDAQSVDAAASAPSPSEASDLQSYCASRYWPIPLLGCSAR